MSNLIFLGVGLTIASYIIGSIPFAIIMSKAFGLADPRTYGSGNPGATNVLRSGKKAAAVLTLLGDTVKGWLAVKLAYWFGPYDDSHVMLMALAALAVFLGHVFPVFLRFKGGKGVATALGVLLAFYFPLGLAVLATWLFVAWAFRYSSLSALVAAAAAPVYAVLFLPGKLLLATLIMSMLLIWRHKNNIRNLLDGTETKIGSKKPEEAATPATDTKPE
jgi:glycerol-3-phosphate acyltransferase PlsY